MIRKTQWFYFGDPSSAGSTYTDCYDQLAYRSRFRR